MQRNFFGNSIVIFRWPVQGAGLRAQGAGLRTQGAGLRIHHAGPGNPGELQRNAVRVS